MTGRGEAAAEGEAFEFVVCALAQASFAADVILAADRTGILGRFTGTRIRAPSLHGSGKQIGDRVAVHLVRQDTLDIRFELLGGRPEACMERIEQCDVDDDHHGVDRAIRTGYR
jgi:hypothetical protein